jgi:predicted RNA-binding Zn ribbon-like protein
MSHENTHMAAEELRLVLMLLNTRYGQETRLHDVWPNRASMEDWLREQGLITGETRVTDADFRRAVEMREAIRQLLRRPKNGDAETNEALTTIQGLASPLLLKVHFLSGYSAGLVPESTGVDGFLGQVAAEIYTAMATGTWTRLKICHNMACSRAFYDGSKNHSRVWCSSTKCGNRMHVRTYRQHKRRLTEGP